MLLDLTISKTTIKQHIVFWLLFIGYESAVNYSFTGHFALLIDYITYNLLNIVFFYLHAYCLKEKVFPSRSAFLLFLSFSLLEVALYVAVKYLIKLTYLKIGVYQNMQSETLLIFLRNNIWRAIYFIGLSTAYAFGRFAIDYKKKVAVLELKELYDQLKKQQLEKDLLLSEIAFRKAQINPHFVFNTLSFVYDRIVDLSETAGELILVLSDIMRYALTELEQDGKVALESEVKHIQNYILLNQHRYNQDLNIGFYVETEIEGIRIIPLVLITLVENIFKYGELRKSEAPASIILSVKDQKLQFNIKNQKTVRTHVHSMGIGMNNIRDRLNSSYPGKNQLIIDENDHSYELTLNVNLQ